MVKDSQYREAKMKPIPSPLIALSAWKRIRKKTFKGYDESAVGFMDHAVNRFGAFLRDVGTCKIDECEDGKSCLDS